MAGASSSRLTAATGTNSADGASLSPNVKDKKLQSVHGRRPVSQRWHHLDHEDVIGDQELRAFKLSAGLPHLQAGDFEKLKPEKGWPEYWEPLDPLTSEGLAIGRSNSGRGGLDDRLRAPDSSGRGGAPKYGLPSSPNT